MTNGLTKKFHGVFNLEKVNVSQFFKQIPYFFGNRNFCLK